jgi:sodium transport system permease protein
VKEAAWQFAVPVLGQLAALSRVVRGEELRVLDWLLPSAIAALVATGCILLVARLLADERIVFGRA